MKLHYTVWPYSYLYTDSESIKPTVNQSNCVVYKLYTLHSLVPCILILSTNNKDKGEGTPG